MAVVAGLVLVMFTLSPADAAFAGDPVALDGRTLVDQTDSITAERETVQNALDVLAATRGVHLFVVYTDRFTNPDDREGWAEATANQNGLGGMDALLAVATVSGSWQLHLGSDVPLSYAQLSAVASEFIVPAFDENDWAGIAIGTARGIDYYLSGAPLGPDGAPPSPAGTPSPEITPSPGSTPDQSGAAPDGEPATARPDERSGSITPQAMVFITLVGSLACVVLLALLAGAGLAIAIRIRRHTLRRRQRAEIALRRRSRELNVDEALLGLDTALSSGKSEYGFAAAQFGEENLREFADTMAGAERTLVRVSDLSAELRDAPATGDEAALDSQTSRILDLCRGAAASLEANVQACSDLRRIDLAAETAVARSHAALVDLSTGEKKSRDILRRLSERFDAVAVAQAVEAVQQAHAVRDAVRIRLEHADRALANGASVAIDVREADRNLAEANVLVRAPAHLEQELDTAAAQLPEAIARAQGEVNVARWCAASSEGQRTGPLADVLQEAIENARSSGTRDPISTIRALADASAPLACLRPAMDDEAPRLPRGAQPVL